MNRIAKRALMVWTLAAACGTAAADVVGPESFEAGFGGWVKDSAVVGALPFAPEIARATAPAHSGAAALTFSARGNNGNGAVWLEKNFGVDAGTYDVALTFWMWSPVQSDAEAWNVVGAIGTADPEAQGDLAIVGRAGIAAGWRSYTLHKALTTRAGEPLWVAFGLGVTSRTDQKYGFDDVTVDISRHTCRTDLDHSGQVTVQDIFMFLDKWFSGSPLGDYNGSGGVNIADIFDFLSAWFAGCEGGV
jgi:hypothetical protein